MLQIWQPHRVVLSRTRFQISIASARQAAPAEQYRKASSKLKSLVNEERERQAELDQFVLQQAQVRHVSLLDTSSCNCLQFTSASCAIVDRTLPSPSVEQLQ